VAALLVILPILAVVFLNLPHMTLGNRVALTLAALFCVAEAAAAIGAPPEFWTHSPTLFPSLDLGPLLGTSFPVDSLARVMYLSIAIVGLSAVFVSHYHARETEHEFRFANLLLLIVAAMNGVVLVHDLFALYVFLEITAIASLILIVIEKGRAAFEGAFKYMVLGAVATSLLLSGLALLFIVSGSTSFEAVAAALAQGQTSQLELLAVALFLGGLAIKAGLVPFHGWLPDAYSSAPAPVSVLLAGIVTKTTGVYTLIRLVTTVFGYPERVRPVLLAVGLLSIVAGALLALGQRDMKRMLAYSSVSQIGYIVLGLAAGTKLGLAGAVFHLFNHAIFKTLLFVNAAAVEEQAGTRDMDQLGGISSRMPVTGTTSVIALLSTAGVPPFAGFWSKLFIVIAVWQSGHPGFAAVAVLASVLTLAYFLSMQRRVFFGELAAGCTRLREANAWGLVPALLLAAITVAVGLSVPWLFDTFLLPVETIL
jgi:multicomponent Na+:H+ antiporter subunit D